MYIGRNGYCVIGVLFVPFERRDGEDKGLVWHSMKRELWDLGSTMRRVVELAFSMVFLSVTSVGKKGLRMEERRSTVCWDSWDRRRLLKEG